MSTKWQPSKFRTHAQVLTQAARHRGIEQHGQDNIFYLKHDQNILPRPGFEIILSSRSTAKKPS